MKDFAFSNRFFAFAGPLMMVFVLQVVGICAPVDADPETAVNEAGTSHTVVATLEEPDPNIEWFAFFFVFFGPNEGQNSVVECDGGFETCDDEFEDCLVAELNCLLNCSPPGCSADGDVSISWTYESNGACSGLLRRRAVRDLQVNRC